MTSADCRQPFTGVRALKLFLNEDIDYARHLINCGVAAQLDLVPGAFQGFDDFSGTAAATRFRSRMIEELRKMRSDGTGTLWSESDLCRSNYFRGGNELERCEA